MSDLLVGKVRVGQRGYTGLVRAVTDQPTAQLGTRSRLSAGQHKRGVAEIHERDLTAILDPPAMSKPGRQTRLAPVGHLRGRHLSRHACIVTGELIQDRATRRDSHDRRHALTSAPAR